MKISTTLERLQVMQQMIILATIVMKKRVIFTDFEIPCYNQEFGSCTYEDVCTNFANGGFPLSCPIEKGIRNIDTDIQLPGVPSVAKVLGSKGTLKIEMKLYHLRQEIGCYKLDLDYQLD